MNAVVAALTNTTTGLLAQATSFVTGSAVELVGATAVLAALALGMKYVRRTIR